MTGQKQSAAPVVSRDYEHAPNACARAVALLLKKLPAKKKGGPETAPKDAMKGLTKHDRAEISIHE